VGISEPPRGGLSSYQEDSYGINHSVDLHKFQYLRGGVNIMYENLFCILPKKIIDLVHDLVYN